MRTEFELILNFQTHRSIVLSLRKRGIITGWKCMYKKGRGHSEFTLQTLSTVIYVFWGVWTTASHAHDIIIRKLTA